MRMLLMVTALLSIGLVSLRGYSQTSQPANFSRTTGSVKEITSDYLLVQAADDSPARYWFKWSGKPDVQPDNSIKAVLARLTANDYVEVYSSMGDRRTLESVKPVVAPEPVIEKLVEKPVQQPTTAIASTQPASVPVIENTTGQSVNAMIDNLVATGERLLELPFFILAAAVGLLGLTLAVAMNRLKKRGYLRQIEPRLVIGIFIMLAGLLIIDRKISRLQDAVSDLRTNMSATSSAMLDTINKLHAQRQAFLFNADQTHAALAKQFGDVGIHPLVYDQATDFVQMNFKSPLVKAYLAIIDLQNPGIEIKLGAAMTSKSLTSAFAKENDCTIAINGEAGTSPAPNSGLGVWRGNMVKLGQTISQESTSIPRPFVSFDRKNHASFTSAVSTNRSMPADNYNVIWGRVDALIAGQVQTGDTSRQPRTAMGISKDGTRLFLLVVDGRQPSYSIGFTRAEVGQVMNAFGASDAMLCDEGGSSCIYVKQFGGIANIPSDNMGQERATYTHFGVALRDN